MDSEPSQFEDLRKLLSLKRHEQPPPGYFNRLPGQIAARIERGEGRLGFWERFMAEFTFRPALAYGFALVAFSALTLSVIYSVRMQPEQTAQMLPNSAWRTGLADEALASQFNSTEPLHVANWMGNTNPGAPSALPSLFSSSARHPAVAVSFASPP
jgi:hypothetical protein